MKRFVLAAILLLAAVPAMADGCRVLSWDATGVTVELSAPAPTIGTSNDGGSVVLIDGFPARMIEGRYVLPRKSLLFEVPAIAGLRIETIDADVVSLDGGPPAIFRRRDADGTPPRTQAGPDAFVTLGTAGTYRSRPMTVVSWMPVLRDDEAGVYRYASRLVARLSFPPAAAGDGTGMPRPRDAAIVNADQAVEWRTAGRRRLAAPAASFSFDRSEHWLRLRVSEPGLHLVTYNDFLSAGIDPGSIDPSTIRLFSAGPLPQPDLLGDEGSHRPGWDLVEHRIHVGGSSFWDGDSILFWAVGVEGWRNYLDPGADPSERYEHPYETRNAYWLTWGGSFAGQALRMDSLVAAPPAGGAVVDRHVERLHVERDLLYAPMETDDRWYWQSLTKGGISDFNSTFDITSPADGTGTLRTVRWGPFVFSNLADAVCKINGQPAGALRWRFDEVTYKPVPDTLVTAVSNLTAGGNRFSVTKAIDDRMYILWYEIFYERLLRAAGDRLDFFAPAGSGDRRFVLEGFSAGEAVVLDVTDHRAPAVLVDWERTAGGITFGDALAATPRHYVAAKITALRKPAIEVAGTPVSPLVSLRDEGDSPHMVIVYHERFRDAAGILRAHRASSLPGVASPRVRAVDVQDVYDNFSGGLVDPIAIRNYMKFLYDGWSEGGEPVIRHLLIVGNGTYDPKDFLGRGNDLVPFYVNTNYGGETEAIEEDDYLVKLDEGVDYFADLGVGRLTCLDANEALRWARRIVDYEVDPAPGPWRNDVVLVADDEYSTNPWDNDFYFMYDAEVLADRENGVFPRFVDLRKIYLHHYPFEGLVKPRATRDFIDAWNEGALIVNFAGHGSPVGMTDEELMLKRDVFSLSNGSRRPLFLAFSCSVGDLDSPYQRSIAQEMVSLETGGAIATIAGVAPTYGNCNSSLNTAFHTILFPDRYTTEVLPLGTALQLAKMSASVIAYPANNAKYALLCDPALTLSLPRRLVAIDASTVDTMETARRYSVTGELLGEGGAVASVNGNADIVVEEAEERINKVVTRQGVNYPVIYNLPGGEIFHGTVDVVEGRFTASFTVPLRCRTGPSARFRAYVEGIEGGAAGAADTLFVETTGSPPANESPPELRMFFAGQADKVKQGALLVAEISDEDGIATLGADPQSSIFLEFDRDGFPIFVTDYFSYDHGSSTEGRVEYPLGTGLEPGMHSVVMRAFDNLGAAANDTLEFEIVEEGVYTVTDVFNFPNPVSDGTNFVFQLSSPADVQLSLYTVSGVRIWQRRTIAEEGFNNIWWNGRDTAGDRPANGTYLYLLDVTFRDSFHRTETVTGKVVLLR